MKVPFTASDGYAGVTFALLALVKTVEDEPLEADDVDGVIAYEVFPVDDPDGRTTGALAPGAVIGALRTDSRWPSERRGWEIGYNFEWEVPGSLVRAYGTSYQINITIPLVGGEQVKHTHVHTTYPRVAQGRIVR